MTPPPPPLSPPNAALGLRDEPEDPHRLVLPDAVAPRLRLDVHLPGRGEGGSGASWEADIA